MKDGRIFKNLFGVSLLVLVLIAGGLSPAAEGPAAGGLSVVTIEKIDGRWTLLRNGQPCFIRGAGGTAYLDALVEAGGNSIRTWSSSREALDKAGEKGLTVCLGLRMAKPRHGADYTNEEMLRKQRERIAEQVVALQDHPALLLWAIGNEVEHEIGPDGRALVWKEIEKIARRIKQIDPNHPVITVIAGAGEKVQEVKEYCPSLDALGINSYGTLPHVPARLERYGWEKPYLITEFGPRGWWEAEKTEWGLPIEDTSTEKSRFYHDVYKAGIDGKPNCLGSYVFLWGNKQEKTHTWFCLFLPDGTPTEMIDTMTFLWTGRWPENRAPQIGRKEVYAVEGVRPYIFRPGEPVWFAVDASDPEGDPMTVDWDLRPDESDNPATGGDWERRVSPIEGAVLSAESVRARIQLPAEGGNYRIFVYVADSSGRAATANLPIRVE